MHTPTMGNVEKGWIPMLGGGLLTAVGLRRRSLTGLLMVAAGGYLAYRAARAVYCARNPAACESVPDHAKCQVLLDTLGAGVTTGIYDHVAQHTKEEKNASGDLIDDQVDDAGDDSFPCSDPPSYSPRNEAGALV